MVYTTLPTFLMTYSRSKSNEISFWSIWRVWKFGFWM